MTSWPDVLSKALDFLQKPNILGLLIIVFMLAFLAYIVPMGYIGWLSMNSTDRIERAITTLSVNCMRSVAAQRDKGHLTE